MKPKAQLRKEAEIRARIRRQCGTRDDVARLMLADFREDVWAGMSDERLFEWWRITR